MRGLEIVRGDYRASSTTIINQEKTSCITLTSIIEAALLRSAEVLRPFATASGSGVAKALEKREKRLLDAYAAGVIDLDELRRERGELRKRAALADKTASREQTGNGLGIEQFVGLVVKGAYSLARVSDQMERKKIIHGLLECVLVKGAALVGFRLSADLRPQGSTAVIYLPVPFHSPCEAQPPEGMKRCIRCAQIKPIDDFRRPLNRCRRCVADQERNARLQRIARAESAEKGQTHSA